ncbi:MAG: hypothetical protein D6820_11205 [Lentisphaerae bacterium]|nr:MAG: hypothetical protein D6820_11205 [Lentisphaerota bacterium]
MEFFDGNSKIGEDTTAPYSCSWTGASIGNHSLIAKATDNDGVTTSSVTVTITVQPTSDDDNRNNNNDDRNHNNDDRNHNVTVENGNSAGSGCIMGHCDYSLLGLIPVTFLTVLVLPIASSGKDRKRKS